MALTRRSLFTLIGVALAFGATIVALQLANDPPSLPASEPSMEPAPDAQTYVKRGDAHLQRVREGADTSLYGDAEAEYREALRRDPRSAGAETGLGMVALARHRFTAGLRHARRARRLAPASSAPFVALVDAYVELGRYPAAGRALQQMVNMKPNLASYARVSYFRELHGDLSGALAAMRLAVAAGGDAPENVAYVQTLLGNLELESGHVERARTAYRTALARLPGYGPAGAGLARIDVAEGRLDSAIARYRDVLEYAPTQEIAVLLGEAELAAGDTMSARARFADARAQQRELRRNGENTTVETAVLEADHGDARLAVRQARRGYAAAPSVRSANALGWALTRAGRPRAGLRYMREALRLGWRDPLVLYHAGIAAREAGATGEARRHLERALERNPRFSPLHAPRARRALKGL
jgi:tetratricopeptide (TPR) repeat protein